MELALFFISLYADNASAGWLDKNNLNFEACKSTSVKNREKKDEIRRSV
tara:strand:- start:623 stop:769 length:147 start_codon:yes stop_codon:yes gene_type:complete